MPTARFRTGPEDDNELTGILTSVYSYCSDLIYIDFQKLSECLKLIIYTLTPSPVVCIDFQKPSDFTIKHIMVVTMVFKVNKVVLNIYLLA